MTFSYLAWSRRGRILAMNYGDGIVTLRLSVSEIAGAKGEPRTAHQIVRLVADQSWTPRGTR